MRRESQRFLARQHRLERGASLVILAVFLVVLFAFVALSFDVGNVYREQRKAHAATDAAALAGVLKLLSGSPAIDAIGQATLVAATNGVTAAEISDAGAIQVGTWAGRPKTFTASPTATPPFNAVRVPARRTVNNYFAQIVGMPVMKPAVHSIAEIGTLGVPVAVQTDVVYNAFNSGGALNLTNSAGVSGNWGPVQICDDVMNGENEVEDAIKSANCFITLGPTDARTGFAGVKNGLTALIGSEFVMPIVAAWPPGGSGHPVIVDAMEVKLLGVSGNGNNLTIDLQIEQVGLSALTNRATRALVQ
jgi:Flp pilus assembly protein TadG